MRLFWRWMLVGLIFANSFLAVNTRILAINRRELKAQEVIRVNVGNARIIELQNPVGEIKLSPSTDNQLKIMVEKVVKNAPAQILADLIDRTKIVVKKYGNKIVIQAVDKKNQTTDIFRLKSQKYYSKSDLIINYKVTVPVDINGFNLNVDVGEIDLKNIKGSFDLKVDTGSIIANRLQVVEQANFVVDTGKINTKFSNIARAKTISLKAEIGDVKLALPRNAKCTIAIDEYMEERRVLHSNGGGTAIKAEAALGRVKIRFD